MVANTVTVAHDAYCRNTNHTYNNKIK